MDRSNRKGTNENKYRKKKQIMIFNEKQRRTKVINHSECKGKILENITIMNIH